MKPYLRIHLRDILFIVIGSLIMAVAYALFIAPASIVPGGVYGLSIIINHLSKGMWDGLPEGLPIGTVALCFNIPLFLLAARKLGRFSAMKTVLTFVLIALFTDVITRLSGGKALVEGEPLLCSFYGGAILGFSVYLIFIAQSTCAGTDTLARVLARRVNIRLSTLIIVIDSVIVLLGLITFGDWRVPLYSWITIFIYGKVIDILQPANPHKSVFIISSDPKLLRDMLVGKGFRGTLLHGQGMYQGQEREVIFIIIERRHLQGLKQDILSLDPKAFITTADASNDSTPILI
ncbi:MAG: YitT family protein [Porphyromonadaceae bacterium]|nr:YitT family protein [Porphyromonadaceae bacterium]